MNVATILNKFLKAVTPKMHAKRFSALHACVESIVKGSPLTVTSIGRGIQSKAFEKHAIKRADRLCSNRHLLCEIPDIYQSICQLICAGNQRPVIHVDWSDLDAYGKYFLIRASLAFKGRSITLFEEVHTKRTKEKPETHRLFLSRLKSMLPPYSKPIIVTDAGFRGPWFQLVKSLHWDFVGRVRNATFCRRRHGDWFACKQLYQEATSKPKALIDWELNRREPLSVNFILYKNKSKGRSSLTRRGDKRRCKASLGPANREREPWLLATSLSLTTLKYDKLVKIYASRMQIEEAFRDQKSSRFGAALEYHYCQKIFRLTCLMLLGTLALILLTLIGISATNRNFDKHFKANTTKANTLSYAFIGRRMIDNARLSLSIPEIIKTIQEIQQTSKTYSEVWCV